MEIHLIRHGETDLNANQVTIGGRSNEMDINAKGILQAQKLGQRLKKTNTNFDVIYSSIAKRTQHTTQEACQIMGHPLDQIILSEQIQELDQGDFTGKLRTEIYTPELLQIINQDNRKFCPPNGESQEMVEQRMFNWIEAIRKAYPEISKIAAFTHGFAIKCLLRGILDFNPKNTFDLEIDNTSITKLKFKKNHWIPTCINDTAHLED